MQIAYYLGNVGKLITSRQGGDLHEIKSEGISWVCGVGEVHSHGGASESRETETPDASSRIMIASGCKSDRKIEQHTALYVQFPSFNGPKIWSCECFFLSSQKRLHFSRYFCPLSLLACICIHSINIYLASTMPGPEMQL